MSNLKGAPKMLVESAKLWWKEGKLGLALAGAFVVVIVLFAWLR